MYPKTNPVLDALYAAIIVHLTLILTLTFKFGGDREDILSIRVVIVNNSKPIFSSILSEMFT